MKISQVSKMVEGQVVVDSTDVGTMLWCDPLLAAGGTELLIWHDQAGTQGTGTFTSKVRYRFASVRTEKPEDWVNGTNARTGDGQFSEGIDISATTNLMWVQAGLGAYESGGLAEAFCRLQSQVQGNGVLVAIDVIQVEPTTNSGQSQHVAIGKRFPQLGLTKLMFGFIFSGVSGTVTYRPLYRELKGDNELPTDWTALGTADSTKTSDETANTGLLTVSPTSSNMFGQAGLKFSGDARGSIKDFVAAVY